MDISILIISYNTRELTLACLQSLYEQTAGVEFEVIVVDNCSADGSADAIEQRFPQVRLVRQDKNLGFAGGNNEAAHYARGQWLLLLNPDTIILDGAIQKLYHFAGGHPEGAIFGGRTFFADGSLNPMSCWQRPTPWSAFCIGSGLTAVFRRSWVFNPEAFGSWPRDTVREVDIVSGCFFLIRREVWKELRGFDPAFFMYGEEADLCLRANQLGYRGFVTPDARIVHYGGASEKVRSDQMVRLIRAKSQLYRRHWPKRWHGFGVFCLDLWAFSRMAVTSVLMRLRPQKAESFKTWQSIWRRRAEWHEAHPEATTQGPAVMSGAKVV